MGNPTGNPLSKVIIPVGQLPLIALILARWDTTQQWIGQHPIRAAFLGIGYELVLLLLAFGKKVWVKIEDNAVQRTTEWLLKSITTSTPGFKRRYKKQMVLDHGIFNVRGLGLISTYTLHLDQVFVHLRIAPSGNPRRPNLNPISKKEYLGNRPIWDFLRQDKRRLSHTSALAIIGPPGCGKTTLLQHVALMLATNRQRKFGIGTYTPILLFLRDHVASFDEGVAPPLGKLLEEYFANTTMFPSLRPPPMWFQSGLERGKCIILLDGLDEITELQKRRTVAAWIDLQIKNYPYCQFLVTARPQGYLDTPLDRADVLEVQPFDSGQVRKFVKNWYLANEVRSSGNVNNEQVRSKAEKEANDLLQRLRGLPALNELTVNPLLLTMIAMVHRYHGALPASRAELYGDICEVLLRRWQQAKGLNDTLSAAQKLAILRPLAATMMESRIRDITIHDAHKVIGPLLNRVGFRSDSAEEFLINLQTNSGLLLEREAGHWSFAHLTFQEFLTASFWIAQRTGNQNWIAMVGDSWWHETLRLYVAQGDGTPIIQACLENPTLSSLTLAADCLDSASELAEDARQRALECLIADLESPDPARRQLAAEVQLSRRLRSMHTIDDQRAIDPCFVTRAEYQLFLDAMREQGKYYQPDHWTSFNFEPGTAQLPVTGIRVEDAQAFCEWLTQRQGGDSIYRLPRMHEIYLPTIAPLEISTWFEEGREFGLTSLSPDARQVIENNIHEIKADMPLPASLACTLVVEHDRILKQELVIKRDVNLTRALNSTLGLRLAIDGNFPFKLSLLRDRVLARDLARDRGSDLILAGKHASRLAHDLSRELEFVYSIDRNRSHAQERELEQDLTQAIHRTLQNRVENKIDRNAAHQFAIDLTLAHELSNMISRDLARDVHDAHGIDSSRAINRARDLANALTRALDFALTLAHDFEREQELNVDRDLARELALALVHAWNPTPETDAQLATALAAAIEGSEIVKVLLLSRNLQASSDNAKSSLGSLLIDILAAVTADSIQSSREAQRKYLAQILQYAYKGLDEIVDEAPSFWLKIFSVVKMKPDSFLSLEGQQEMTLGFYWWLRIVTAREKQRLPAWESLRIIREQG